MAKFCKKCGAQLTDEAAFCPNCGASQGTAAQQPQQHPQAQPQAQPPRAPAKQSAPVISASDIGFKGEDLKFNPVRETLSGDLSRYSLIALFVALGAFFFSLLDIFGTGASMRVAELSFGFRGFGVFRTVIMVVFITSVVWVMFKMFIKKVNYFDMLVLACGSALWFLVNLIETIIVGVRARSGITFAAILFFIFILTAIAAGILPFILKITKKK